MKDTDLEINEVNNIGQQVKPEYSIHIGIKDSKVVSMNWKEMTYKEEFDSTLEIYQQIIKHLNDAKEEMKQFCIEYQKAIDKGKKLLQTGRT